MPMSSVPVLFFIVAVVALLLIRLCTNLKTTPTNDVDPTFIGRWNKNPCERGVRSISFVSSPLLLGGMHGNC